MDADVILAIRPALTELLGCFASCFADHRTAAHLDTYVSGQLGGLDRKSVEPIADAAGVPPRTLQQFLGLADWNHERMRDRTQQRIARRHAHPGSIGIIDETSFPKKGDKTACVQRQHCGALGKTENCVVSVHLGYATPGLTEPSDPQHPLDPSDFHTLLDSDLYLPKTTWDADPQRKAAARVPEEVTYRPMWQIALGQIDRALGNGIRFGYLTFDEAYAKRKGFLEGLDERGQRYVAEIPRDLHLWTRRPAVLHEAPRGQAAKPGRPLSYPRLKNPDASTKRCEEVAADSSALSRQPWTRYLVKEGTKGPAVWEAKRILVHLRKRDGLPSEARHFIVARNVINTKEVKMFLSNADASVSLEELMTVAFSRWRIERMFQDAKMELGMDHFEVRSYLAIQRHLIVTTLSLLFLAEFKQTARRLEQADHRPSGDQAHGSTAAVGSAPTLNQLATVLRTLAVVWLEGGRCSRERAEKLSAQCWRTRHRNLASTRSARKRRVADLQALGIKVDELPRCVWIHF